jgi:hypothetical protein
MPWYRREGKILEPLTDEQFNEGMKRGLFLHQKHRAFNVLLYYSAVRKMEALRSLREQYQITKHNVNFSVGVRLKHGFETQALPLPLEAPFMEDLITALENTERGKRVFPYCPKTGYNVVERAFKYPHLFRLSRITNFFLEGWTIAQVRNWTGLSLKALEYYIGNVNLIKMGKSLR